MTISFFSKLLEGLVMVSKWELIRNLPKNKCCHFNTYMLFDAQGLYQAFRMDQNEFFLLISCVTDEVGCLSYLNCIKLFGRAYSLRLNLLSS